MTVARDSHSQAAALFASGPAFFAEVMGLFEYNNIDVEVASPISQFFAAKGIYCLVSAEILRQVPSAGGTIGGSHKLMIGRFFRFVSALFG